MRVHRNSTIVFVLLFLLEWVDQGALVLETNVLILEDGDSLEAVAHSRSVSR